VGVALPAYRPGRNRPAFLPLLIAAIQVTGCLCREPGQGPANALDGLAFALSGRRPARAAVAAHASVLTFAVVQVATVAYLVLDYPRGPFFVAAIIALFNAARHGHGWRPGSSPAPVPGLRTGDPVQPDHRRPAT
jgi:hypothetical protein